MRNHRSVSKTHGSARGANDSNECSGSSVGKIYGNLFISFGVRRYCALSWSNSTPTKEYFGPRTDSAGLKVA